MLFREGVSVEAVDSAFQAQMLDMLKQTHRNPEIVLSFILILLLLPRKQFFL